MDHSLMAKVDLWLAQHRQEIIDDLIGLVRIPSVSVPDEAVPPYGQACRDALKYMFALGERHEHRCAGRAGDPPFLNGFPGGITPEGGQCCFVPLPANKR